MGAKRVGMWKGIAFVGSLRLRGMVGMVGRRTLMKLRVVSPINVLTHDGLRVAPEKGIGVRCPVRCHNLGSAYLGFDLSLPCLTF